MLYSGISVKTGTSLLLVGINQFSMEHSSHVDDVWVHHVSASRQSVPSLVYCGNITV